MDIPGDVSRMFASGCNVQASNRYRARFDEWTDPVRTLTVHRGPARRPRRLPSLVLRLVSLAMLAAVLGGCVQAEVAVRVDDDGSGTASVLFAFDKSLLELLGSFGQGDSSSEGFDPKSVFDGVDKTQLPPGTTVEPYEGGDFVGARITAPFEKVEDLPALLDRITSGVSLPSDTSASDTGSGFERFVIERAGEGWRFEAVVEPASTADSGGSSDELGGDLAASFLKDASFTVKVKLPGKVQEHNADEEDSGELTWDLDLQSSEPRVLSARSAGGDGEFPWVIVAGGVIGLLAVSGVAWDIARRRRRAATES